MKAKQSLRVMALLSSASSGDISKAVMHLHAYRLFSAGPHTVLWPVCSYLPMFNHPPSIELVSLSTPLSPQSSRSHLESCCSSGVSHPPDLLPASDHMDPESLCPPRKHFLFLSLVGFGTVCAQFEFSIRATRMCVFVKIKPE